MMIDFLDNSSKGPVDYQNQPGRFLGVGMSGVGSYRHGYAYNPTSSNLSGIGDDASGFSNITGSDIQTWIKGLNAEALYLVNLQRQANNQAPISAASTYGYELPSVGVMLAIAGVAYMLLKKR